MIIVPNAKMANLVKFPGFLDFLDFVVKFLLLAGLAGPALALTEQQVSSYHSDPPQMKWNEKLYTNNGVI